MSISCMDSLVCVMCQLLMQVPQPCHMVGRGIAQLLQGEVIICMLSVHPSALGGLCEV